MYSPQVIGTVRRNARVGLRAPMGAQHQGSLYRSLAVAPNVRRLNALRGVNSRVGSLPPQLAAADYLAPAAAPPGVGVPAQPGPVEQALQALSAAMMRGRRF